MKLNWIAGAFIVFFSLATSAAERQTADDKTIARPDLSGTWLLNAERSDKPRRPGGERGEGGGMSGRMRGPGGPGGMGGMGGGRMGSGMDPEQMKRRMEVMRDPRTGFITYVPIGSVARGAAIVTTGGGKTIQCGLCHGPAQQGQGDIPGTAGRTASYLMRQLWDIKQGTRKSPGIMEPVVANLTADDLLGVVAYLASLPP